MRKLVTIILTFILTIYLINITVMPSLASSSKKQETSKHEISKESHDSGKEVHGEENHGEDEHGGGHETEEIHHDAGIFQFSAHHAEWKFPAWKVAFAALSVLFFGLAINTLPKFITDKSAGGGDHH